MTLCVALQDVYKEGGLLAFYRGLMVKFTDNIAGKFAYFYLFSFFRNAASRTSKGAKLSTVVELAIGYLAAVGNLMLTHPLDVVYVRLASSPQGSTVTSTLQKLVREEGLFGLYQGTAAGLALCINPAIQFLVFERLKTQFLKATRSSSLTMLSGFFLGAVAKAIATSLTFPLIRLKALYSNGSVDKSRHGDSDPSLMEVLRDIYETEGMVGLYKGITPQLLKVCLSAAVMFSIKERIYDVTRALILARARRRARKLMAGK